jgi:hypothetical protein
VSPKHQDINILDRSQSFCTVQWLAATRLEHRLRKGSEAVLPLYSSSGYAHMPASGPVGWRTSRGDSYGSCSLSHMDTGTVHNSIILMTITND